MPSEPIFAEARKRASAAQRKLCRRFTCRFFEGFGHSSEAAELDPSAKQFTGLFRALQQW